MPPKRKASDKNEESGRLSKKVKAPEGLDAESTTASETSSSPGGQPTNKVLPVNISFPQRIEGTTRISAWNVAGLAASQKKGFKFYLEAEDPDILVLTETKVNNEPVDPTLTSRFPHSYWTISATKTYAGVAVLSKHKPLSVDKSLPGHPDPTYVKGRIITLEFENSYLVSTYVPNAGEKLKTMEQKKLWNTHFEKYIRDLDKVKPVIWTGDLNVAPTEVDLTNAKRNWNKTPGYTEAETTAFKNILDPPENAESDQHFTDLWRKLHPADKHYTYFSYRFNCRAKGIGWRLDMFVLSNRLVSKAKMCEIRSDIYGASDHCPIVMEIEEPL